MGNMSNIATPARAAKRQPPPIKPVSHGRAVAVLALGTAFLAATPLLVKAANMDPATQAFLRVFIGFLCLLPFGIMEIKKKEGLARKGIIYSVISGLFLGIDFTAWNYSIFYIGAGVAAILLNLQVIIVPMLTAIFDKYKIPPVFLVLVPIMAVGVLLTGGVFEPSEATGPDTIYGIKTATLGTAFGLTSGVCYSFYLYFSRKAGTSARKDLYIQPMMYTAAAQMVAPTIVAYTVSARGGFDFKNGVLVDGVLPAVNPETALGDPLTAWNWIALILLATFGQALAWTFVQYGTVWLDPTLSAGILLLSPVTSVIIAAPLFGEVPSVLQIIGVLMILATVAYQNGLFSILMGKRKKPDEENPDEMLDEQLQREGLAPGHSPDDVPDNPKKHHH
ncbi:Permease of the drug/metabolite transporter (DMT) superfamily [Corynebacterium appendicis CIP 107643]|uniref:Permease of the drug/metabolite transporter (DMT) superfamily n=2 Tax=Corynebacterium appendicis TaxID=163202 RepID=A0A1N7JXR7_9CORY|nr:EamA-like transporter family protein [Corynebacterium appendicis CIP 107643]SIS54120.1 Permease of the drug/metabolite transporter (DMT) superfamily [Corynebacterium appendicis CIP 107643]